MVPFSPSEEKSRTIMEAAMTPRSGYDIGIGAETFSSPHGGQACGVGVGADLRVAACVGANMPAAAATGVELQGKFLQDAADELNYSGLNTFFGGLEARIGPPDPNIREAMASELPAPGADGYDSPADLHAMQFEWLPEVVASARAEIEVDPHSNPKPDPDH